MKVSIVNIGNSKGIRLSKTLIEKYQIKDDVELELAEDHIKIIPKTNPRTGWDDAFRQMHQAGDDKLLIDDVFDDENPAEWK